MKTLDIKDDPAAVQRNRPAPLPRRDPMGVNIAPVNPVPPGYSAFSPVRAPGVSPQAPGAEAPLGNQLTASLGPMGQPTGPAVPSPQQQLQTNFNSFLTDLISSANASPTGRLDPFEPKHQAILDRQRADKEEDILYQTEKMFTETSRKRSEDEMKALKPLWDRQDKAYADMQKELQQSRLQIPVYKPVVMDANDTNAFVMAVLAVALIGGTAGKSGWMTVAQNVNGMLEGFIQGDAERAKRYNEDFQRSYEAATNAYKMQREKWQDILYATDVPINRILKQAEVQAKIDGSDEKMFTAQQGHIDKLRKMAEDEEKMAIGVEQAKAKIDAAVAISIARLAGGSGRGAGFTGANLDNYGMWAAAKIAAGGNTQLLSMLTTRWAAPQRAEIFNMMAKEWADQGIDPSSITQAQITIAVEKKAQTWSVMRWEAMNRLEVALEELQPAIKTAILAANQLRPRAANTPLNKLTKEFTSGPQAEKIAYANTLALTVGREYITLATMPVSNAQMHWGSAALADQMVSGGMSLAELDGFYGALKKEISANKHGLEEATRLSMQDVMSLGGSVRPEDFGLPAKNSTAEKHKQWEQDFAPNTTQH